MLEFPEAHLYAKFAMEEIWSEAGPSLICVNLSSTLINKFDTQHMKITDIFAFSLTILRNNLNPVTSLGKTNMIVFCIKPVGKYRLGLNIMSD